jgi:periplasmic protein TonB
MSNRKKDRRKGPRKEPFIEPPKVEETRLEPKQGRVRRWWTSLTTGEKTGTVIGISTLAVAFLTLVVATAVVPEVRYALHLEKRPEPPPAADAPKPPESAADGKEPATGAESEKPSPFDPKFELIPMPEKTPPKIPIQRAQNSPGARGSMGAMGGMGGSIGGMVGAHKGGATGAAAGAGTASASRSKAIDGLSDIFPTHPLVSVEQADRLLEHRVDPVYPAIAREARLYGMVRLRVFVDKTGKVQSIETESGNPMLVVAALDAVKQWRYKPLVVGGEPIPWKTDVTINFSAENKGVKTEEAPRDEPKPN